MKLEELIDIAESEGGAKACINAELRAMSLYNKPHDDIHRSIIYYMHEGDSMKLKLVCLVCGGNI